MLHETLYSSTLPSCVSTFEEDNNLLPFRLHPGLRLQKLDLKMHDALLVLTLRQLGGIRKFAILEGAAKYLRPIRSGRGMGCARLGRFRISGRRDKASHFAHVRSSMRIVRDHTPSLARRKCESGRETSLPSGLFKLG